MQECTASGKRVAFETSLHSPNATANSPLMKGISSPNASAHAFLFIYFLARGLIKPLPTIYTQRLCATGRHPRSAGPRAS